VPVFFNKKILQEIEKATTIMDSDGDEVIEDEEDMEGDADPIDAAAPDIGAVQGAEEQHWISNPGYMTGPNSPTKIASTSNIWRTIRRLKQGHPKLLEGFTHACIEPGCGRFIVLTKSKGKTYWTSTKAGGHIKRCHIIEDLMDLDMGVVFLDIIKSDPDRMNFGFMPLLASSSEGEIGAVNAESYAERVISAANLTMDHGNTSMKDDIFDMLVVLRMNRDFMSFMRKNYFAEIKALQPFNLTVVRNEEEKDSA